MIGPFNLKDLIIVGGIIASVSVAMYFMKGFLSLPIVQGLWLIVIEIVVTAGIIILLGKTIMGYCKWGPEGFLFATARTTGVDIYIDAEIGSLKAEFVLGEKNNPKDVAYADEESGVKIDPSMMSANAKPLHFPLGLDVHVFSFYNYMAQSLTNHAAFKELKTYREEIRATDILAFLPIKEWVELISCPEHFLDHNARMKLNKYYKVHQAHNEDNTPKVDDKGQPVLIHYQQYLDEKTKKFYVVELSLTDMKNALAKQRNDLAKRPILGGYLTLTEAFENNSIAASSQHIQQLRMLDKQAWGLEWLKSINWAPIIPVVLAVCGGIAIILAVVFVLAPKAATGGAG